jgi:precorrin-6Y C5,15-methyltransferase (decarboxylating) CbiT subunit
MLAMNARDALNRKGPLPDGWFERAEGIPMTKEFTRSAVISLLSPLCGSRVLEIGAGTGAMTTELARAVGCSGLVTSVEISQTSARLATLNLERAGLSDRVRLLEGGAPQRIPESEYGAVFIGGHGDALEPIMRRCFGLISPGGRMVLTSVTPRTTSAALAAFDEITPDVGFWRFHQSSGRRVGVDWLMAGNNPVDIIWGDK